MGTKIRDLEGNKRGVPHEGKRKGVRGVSVRCVHSVVVEECTIVQSLAEHAVPGCKNSWYILRRMFQCVFAYLRICYPYKAN